MGAFASKPACGLSLQRSAIFIGFRNNSPLAPAERHPSESDAAPLELGKNDLRFPYKYGAPLERENRYRNQGEKSRRRCSLFPVRKIR